MARGLLRQGFHLLLFFFSSFKRDMTTGILSPLLTLHFFKRHFFLKKNGFLGFFLVLLKGVSCGFLCSWLVLWVRSDFCLPLSPCPSLPSATPLLPTMCNDHFNKILISRTFLSHVYHLFWFVWPRLQTHICTFVGSCNSKI
ncbi:hypothetical protein BZA05DRAFT_30437 [Tricharina praecox]|uniref:uncharacterized protein n=1 Tax=Tricharina praecox TaxID=43433 RepID=UPI00221F602D|nr:uncharacterized protein BZA05DRAFT_30437 [Tricharina praecox]KAI5853469.1 hypothetical protein BZA05DRAFT_30437 [Tricharina praecox]